MTIRYLIRCLKLQPCGRCNFLLEWHPTHDAMTAAVAEHQCRDWDTIDWGEVTVSLDTHAASAGGWTIPLQLSLWKGENA
jgi:hypothetical protein